MMASLTDTATGSPSASTPENKEFSHVWNDVHHSWGGERVEAGISVIRNQAECKQDHHRPPGGGAGMGLGVICNSPFNENNL